jgi:excisionase family DNA binding protein
MLRKKGFLRVKEAAEVLGVSPNTVRSWGAQGKIPEYRHPLNNYRLYKRSELDKLLGRLFRQVRLSSLRNRG